MLPHLAKKRNQQPIVTEKDTIALFPQEWTRDSESTFLQTAYHDVPWEEPELIRDCVNHRRKQSSWYSRTGQKPAAVDDSIVQTRDRCRGKSRGWPRLGRHP